MRWRGNRWKYTLLAIWVIFTLSLIGWWFYFGLLQVGRLAELEHAQTSNLVRYQKMLLWEGSALVLCLLFGAGAMLYYIVHERRQRDQYKEFLATFSHELKTPLSSLRLQAEIMREKFGDTAPPQELDRLVAETARLALQLENALFLTRRKDQQLYIEHLKLSDLLNSLGSHWPDIKIVSVGDAIIHADRRSIESILDNLIHNARTHGAATELQVSVSPIGSSKLRLHISNNGRSFMGNAEKLGKLFERHTPSSGSGIGLHLVKRLAQDLGGKATFNPSPDRFSCDIELAGEVI